MNFRKSLTLSALFMFSVIAILPSCKEKKQKFDSNIVYSEQLAKEISHVTSGEVRFDDPIQVIFNNPVVEESDIDSSPADVFSFSPKLSGAAKWVSTSVLVFTPDEPLPLRKNFEGKLNLQKLSSDFKEREMEELVFSFRVIGREIKGFNASLELVDRDNPRLLVYRGTVFFSEKTSLEAVKEAATIQGDDNVNLVWSQVDDWNYKFTTTDITRTNKNKKFKLTINRKPLDLENTFTESFSVSPLEVMMVSSLKGDETGRSPRIRIDFSDELDMDQDIEGLISISPTVNFSIKKLGKTIILDGGFTFGNDYSVTLRKGIRSRWGTKTDAAATHKVQFADMQPRLEFASEGFILPSSNRSKVQFYTVNLKQVHLQVKKVNTTHIGQFVKSQQLTSTRTRNKNFSDYYSSTVGTIVKSQTIDIASKNNEWLLNELDLSHLFNQYDDGLFLISLNFTPEDISLPIRGDVLEYIYENGQIYKPIFLSNIGITLKSGSGNHKVFATDIITGKPMSGVAISLLDWSGELQNTLVTNSQGEATFRNDYFYYVMAEKGKQITVLNKDEMRWSTSGFDVGGMHDDYYNMKGFIYTERGVYRPGDTINLGFIVRNPNNTFPNNHPVNISVSDPNYNTVFTKTSSQAEDGYYVFRFSTDEKAPTGNYNVRINAGGAWFYHDLKIETVVADQLNVRVNPHKKSIVWTDETIDFDLEVNYLFGAPAANLKAEVSIELHPYTITFPKYAEYLFKRFDVDFSPITQNVQKSELDSEGKLSGSWKIPSLGIVPSALKAKVIAKVIEKGGQTNEGWNALNMHVYPGYVGIKDPSGYGYYGSGKEIKFPVVILDENGNPQKGKEVEYTVYRNDKQWWYHYDSRRDYRLKYKEDNQTFMEVSGKVTLKDGTGFIAFTPSNNGEYLIEVSDGGNGHSTSLFFSAYAYGGTRGSELNEGTLALKTDKAKYQSSEKAKVILPNPKQGNVLVTVEQKNQILSWFWASPNAISDEMTIDIPLNKRMAPNVYVTVSVIQPHDQTQNDRPIRMFGIIPIMIEDESTKIGFTIETDATLTPNKEFEVRISNTNQKKTQFTIAVVDEGLLSLTQFRTPNPWAEFYKKVGLYVQTYDVFSHVMSANKGDVFQTFSIGGADDMDYRSSQLDPIKGEQRFRPVSMFKGPLTTDDKGKAKVKFRMPNYNGAVRIMVVGAQEGSYGSAEKTVPVRSDIIMQPSLPRILKPGDEFTVPVALFRLNPDISSARFTLATQGPIEVIGSSSVNVDFAGKDELSISFKLKVKNAVGQAKIELTGVADGFQTKSETYIKVVPSATRKYDSATKKVAKGQTQTFDVPMVGIEGTNYASLDLSVFPNMDFDHRLKWLINYPFGCIEQVVSTLFPQLYLKEMGYFDKKEVEEINRNINEGIARLQGYILNNGGFSYWPGTGEEHMWASNYATHFLVEARKLGYAVPDHLYDKAIQRLNSLARQHSGDLTTRVNRVFILSLAKEQPMAEMNLMMESNISLMKSVDKWMLAASYHMAGAENIRSKILASSTTQTQEYDPFSYNFGSKYRDDAVILYAATLMGQKETAELMAKGIAKTLSSREYLSTQSSGYMLLSLSKYFESIGLSAVSGSRVSGTVKMGDGQVVSFDSDGRVTIPVTNSLNKRIEVTLSANAKVDEIYAVLSWNGVPAKDEDKDFEKNLNLKVSWYDEDGRIISPNSLKQGATFYGRFSAKNTSAVSKVTELALTQILPSGWQIENIRLSGNLLPEWTKGWNLNKENYMDLRDDRVMWFFDLNGSETLDFVVKLNCVVPGEFWLPSTLIEAMYSSDFKATTQGTKVYVEPFK